jgi:hypothetical protein
MTFAYSLTYGNNNKRKANYRKFINDFTNADLTQNGKQVSQLVDFVQNGVTLLNFDLNETKLRNGLNWTPLELMLTGDFYRYQIRHIERQTF